MKQLVLFLIKFYQKYLTILSFGSCRYHPTCSSYAKIQFEHNNFFKALFFSTIRILKCNPLFDGGFDYPKSKCLNTNKINLKFKRIKVKYWKVPVENNYCLILQHNKIWDKE
ncbi:MAG: membrane protein insertion efficiency factor YidD [Campylobacterota bacterium]|nr:membrane protein insertion efficiency factor YidD [Campylobacterota bacterium]